MTMMDLTNEYISSNILSTNLWKLQRAFCLCVFVYPIVGKIDTDCDMFLRSIIVEHYINIQRRRSVTVNARLIWVSMMMRCVRLAWARERVWLVENVNVLGLRLP